MSDPKASGESDLDRIIHDAAIGFLGKPPDAETFDALTEIIREAINAALAAAIQSQMDKDDEMWSAKLAAERERKETALKMFDEAFDKNIKATQGWAECQKQLAAERLKCDTAIENCMVHRRIATELREQLAAEREIGHNTAVALGQQIIKLEDQVQTLRDALVRCKQGFIAHLDPQHGNLIDAALAKVEQEKYRKCNKNDGFYDPLHNKIAGL